MEDPVYTEMDRMAGDDDQEQPLNFKEVELEEPQQRQQETWKQRVRTFRTRLTHNTREKPEECCGAPAVLVALLASMLIATVLLLGLLIVGGVMASNMAKPVVKSILTDTGEMLEHTRFYTSTLQKFLASQTLADGLVLLDQLNLLMVDLNSDGVLNGTESSLHQRRSTGRAAGHKKLAHYVRALAVLLESGADFLSNMDPYQIRNDLWKAERLMDELERAQPTILFGQLEHAFNSTNVLLDAMLQAGLVERMNAVMEHLEKDGVQIKI